MASSTASQGPLPNECAANGSGGEASGEADSGCWAPRPAVGEEARRPATIAEAGAEVGAAGS